MNIQLEETKNDTKAVVEHIIAENFPKLMNTSRNLKFQNVESIQNQRNIIKLEMNNKNQGENPHKQLETF